MLVSVLVELQNFLNFNFSIQGKCGFNILSRIDLLFWLGKLVGNNKASDLVI